MPKKILFLEHNVDGTVGGSHICLLGICRYVDRSRWSPVACFYQENSLVPAFKDLGVTVLILEPFKPWVIRLRKRRAWSKVMGIVQSMVNFLRMVAIRPWYWVRVLRAQNIDAVHLNNSCGGDVDLVLATKFLRIPVIAHQRGFPPGFGRFERMLARRMDCIIAVSDVIKEHLVKVGIPEEMVVRVHDGIELSGLEQSRAPTELRRELGLASGELVVGMLGNVKHWKGQRVLVEAVPLILERFPTTRFVFVGTVADHRYKSELDERIDALGIGDRVVFTGYRPDAIDLMVVMDVVVHASIEPEPFGLVVLEAMGKGIPVVATNLGGPKETVIDGVTGLLFESGNPYSLAEAVSRFLENKSLRRSAGHAGITQVKGRFTAQKNVQDIVEIYERRVLLNSTRPQ